MKNSQSGFTYIELILYIVIVVILMNALIPFAWGVIEGGAKSATQEEVSSNARFISERIKYEIRNASDFTIGSSTFGSSPGTLTLVDLVAGQNPTVITLASGNITIKQGTGAVTNLNSADTTISNLVFTNNTSSDNKTKNIGFTFTLSSKYSGSRQEYISSVTIQSSAEIRSN